MEHNKPVLKKKQHKPLPLQPTLRKETLSLHDHLPLDLVEEILCRLPVKQLIQLRCVCRLWNSLFSEDSNFAKKHLRLSTTNQGRHHLIIKSSQFLNLQYPISAIFSSRDATISTYSLRDIPKKRESDRDPGGYVSTCDGIICYGLNQYSALLFNPSIRKFIISPPLEFPDQKHAIIVYTLVYDRFINNYKIIALASCTKTEVCAHTLGTDYWRRIQGFPSSIPELMCTSTGIFVNDSVNWLTTHFIVSLDLEKESYQKLSLPVPNVQFRSPCLGGTLGTFRGSLSLLISMKENFSHVWIMKEFGNEKSWTKLLSIPYMSYMKSWWPFRYIKLLYISEDDQVLMEMYIKMNYKLVVYDSKNNTFNFPDHQNRISNVSMGRPEIYVESLISPF
ncbi:hypothetical protein TSUD_391040 [Trifolium subterraneum]|uniref:F-box domain-containing protein n=1 Tax=Trifolium subterraneum TaxID=3900 RepID=A0A2Z6MLY0_TRISU|nr:hypothetical protein TSUD_391040 [Trifolium subterraneum]